jgi:hypothetical protein
MIYYCCDELRRNAVSHHSKLMGIDFLEVSSDQTKLYIHFVPVADDAPDEVKNNKKTTPSDLTESNVRIKGGERITRIRVVKVDYVNGLWVVTVDDDDNSTSGVGDFSTYTFHLVDVPDLDPLLSAVDFSFKVECQSDFDCKPQRVCLTEPLPEPEINYLARDYASFRRLMLDRMAMLMPQWKERNTADLGIALVELLAYVGDHLSYQQDAIATEAYLDTARSRISVRRHARLVDYFMHDGCNARAWVQVNADNSVVLEKGTQMFTRVTGQPVCISLNSQAYDQALQQRPEVFETIHDATLFKDHTELYFYTWGDKRCCLPKGATKATLKDHYPNLKAGDVLIFEEILGPLTGKQEDADPAHRHAVRLIEVYSIYFELTDESPEKLLADGVPDDVVTQLKAIQCKMFFGENNFLNEVQAQIGEAQTTQFKSLLLQHAAHKLVDPLTGDNITEIQWGIEDALPFPLCISAVTDEQHGHKYTENISVARGNIVLADHGCTVQQDFDPVPSPNPRLVRVQVQRPSRCEEDELEKERERLQILPRFRPQLNERPLTQAATVVKNRVVNGQKKTERLPFDPEAPASAAFQWKMEDVMPVVTLNNKAWHPLRDLLASDRFAKEFVVEVEADGTAFLRFGDDQHGLRPNTGTTFKATYRVGNGVAGNVGAESIAHIVSSESAIIGVRNPLSAQGGREPETIEEVRKKAPYAFRTQERAVTEEDYAEVTERNPQVQQSAATFRWTGSWHTVFLTIDRKRGLPVDDTFEKEIRQYVERYRMAGYDLEVDSPHFVSLEIEMDVCVKPDYFRSEVKRALIKVFSNQILPDGRRGVFHPDNFTFGQTVYLSRLYAAAQAVPGVSSAHIMKFIRQDIPDDPKPLEEGKLTPGRLEIARLDNDPNFPEHGVFHLNIRGGK